jgi:acyl carrier protein
MNDTPTVEATVLQVLRDVLDEPVERLTAQPVLAVYGWDSVALLEALALIESALGVTLDLRSYQAARTVADLVELVLRAPKKTTLA